MQYLIDKFVNKLIMKGLTEFIDNLN